MIVLAVHAKGHLWQIGYGDVSKPAVSGSEDIGIEGVAHARFGQRKSAFHATVRIFFSAGRRFKTLLCTAKTESETWRGEHAMKFPARSLEVRIVRPARG